MELTKIEVNDFKCVSHVELDLAPVNILVGTNACGKSSIVQAVHLATCAMRQAQRVDENNTSTVGIEELDYLPTDNYKTLGHNSLWGNKAGTPSSRVSFSFKDDAGDTHQARCTIRSARNAGLSVKGSVPMELTLKLRKKKSFFSAYIPGISGIPNKEEKRSKKVVLKACSFGDANVILRNVLLLLKEKSQDNIRQIETWIENIIGPVSIDVRHDEEKDLFISCDVIVNGDTRPIELLGTGYIQLIQIFSYVLLFSPGVLLVDEPDIHLHPTIQERTVQVLGEVAEQQNIKIILTTHSPFIVRGAPLNAKVIWINGGRVESENRSAVELALGWGAFGKKIIIASEDKELKWLRKVIAQWPEIERAVTLLPGRGYQNVPNPDEAAELSASLGNKFKILIHRDRDSLTDDEVASIQRSYHDKGATCWFTDLSDLEAYFCSPEIIQEIVGCSLPEAEQHIDTILVRQAQPIQEQFQSQRRAHNKELYAEGGSPENAAVWAGFQGRALNGAKGKFVFKQLVNSVGNGFSEARVIPTGFRTTVAQSLKDTLEELLRA
ncbi:ATPase/GTPase, AAA15 family [Paucidesulfovibrio gracilis DSM 16080]|uniref:ATPase/GTPase, AAA15 family n=1 Tax=Paucidesulfovibrio gracilis DSM 16080 TaxID=1121449 RepID=A0A1T4WLP7_9BACT|nr:ATP-binding protein [Paucidesulfovibrio gracilis]SKA78254.1 ATPase/GTPase, AAA15 family [Paucidesulfovibrio gracilis DSM 16080]